MASVQVAWADEPSHEAVVLHSAREVLILEGTDGVRPPEGVPITIVDEHGRSITGRVAEHGHSGRYLVSRGERPVRRVRRLRVSLPGTANGSTLSEVSQVEVSDLTTSGARLRGIEVPVGSDLTLRFTPPGRNEPVAVKAFVVHSTRGADAPWVGVSFRLVALRGGR
jgi:hypothetical protein